MSEDVKKRAEHLRAMASILEILAPFNTTARLQIVIAAVATLEQGTGSEIEKDINRMIERTTTKAGRP